MLLPFGLDHSKSCWQERDFSWRFLGEKQLCCQPRCCFVPHQPCQQTRGILDDFQLRMKDGLKFQIVLE